MADTIPAAKDSLSLAIKSPSPAPAPEKEHHRMAMSKALGAAFLSHQVEQLERSVGVDDRDRELPWRSGGRPRSANPNSNDQGFGPGSTRKRSDSHGQRGAWRNTHQSRRSREENGLPDAKHARALAEENKDEKDADVLVLDASMLVYALSHLRRWAKEGREEFVVVPLEALNTLDALKKGNAITARLARAASRLLEQLVGANDRIVVQRDEAYVGWEDVVANIEKRVPKDAEPTDHKASTKEKDVIKVREKEKEFPTEVNMDEEFPALGSVPVRKVEPKEGPKPNGSAHTIANAVAVGAVSGDKDKDRDRDKAPEDLPAPEWLRRMVCCAAYELAPPAPPSSLLPITVAAPPSTLPIPPASAALPAKPPPAAAPPPSSSEEKEKDSKQRKVLLVTSSPPSLLSPPPPGSPLGKIMERANGTLVEAWCSRLGMGVMKVEPDQLGPAPHPYQQNLHSGGRGFGRGHHPHPHRGDRERELDRAKSRERPPSRDKSANNTGSLVERPQATLALQGAIAIVQKPNSQSKGPVIVDGKKGGEDKEVKTIRLLTRGAKLDP